MLRNLLGLRYYTVGECIRIAIGYALCVVWLSLLIAAFPFALFWLWLNGNLTLSTFRPAAKLCILACGLGLCFGAYAAEQRTDINFVSTVRAFHPVNLAT